MAISTFSAYTNWFNSRLSDINRGDVMASQAQLSYRAFRELTGVKSRSCEGPYHEWDLQLEDNTGSTVGRDLFEGDNPQMGPTTVRARTLWCRKTNSGKVYDITTLRLGNSKLTTIFDMLKTDEEARVRDFVQTIDNELVSNPYSATDEKTMAGLPYHLRLSMTSGGTLTANTDGGFNGTYATLGDATTTGTWCNIDRTTSANERARNYVMTKSASTFDVSTAQQLKKCINNTDFEPIPMTRGNEQVSATVIFMNSEDHEQYQNIVNARGENNATSDLFRFKDVTAYGARVLRVHTLDQFTYNPIYGVNLSKFTMFKASDMWFKRMEAQQYANNHLSFYVPMNLVGALKCDNPREAGFALHNI